MLKREETLGNQSLQRMVGCEAKDCWTQEDPRHWLHFAVTTGLWLRWDLTCTSSSAPHADLVLRMAWLKLPHAGRCEGFPGVHSTVRSLLSQICDPACSWKRAHDQHLSALFSPGYRHPDSLCRHHGLVHALCQQCLTLLALDKESSGSKSSVIQTLY